MTTRGTRKFEYTPIPEHLGGQTGFLGVDRAVSPTIGMAIIALALFLLIASNTQIG